MFRCDAKVVPADRARKAVEGKELARSRGSLFSSLGERIERHRARRNELTEGLPVDTAVVSSMVLQELPNITILSEFEKVPGTLGGKPTTVDDQFGETFAEADHVIEDIGFRRS